jgi:hypothetical protein
MGKQQIQIERVEDTTSEPRWRIFTTPNPRKWIDSTSSQPHSDGDRQSDGNAQARDGLSVHCLEP